MICRVRCIHVIRNISSVRDGRRLVDQNFWLYNAPGRYNPEEWMLMFESKRGIDITPPEKFETKTDALRWAGEIHK